MARIQKRGRGYEQSMSLEYLEGLNRRYDEWIGSYEGRLLVVDTDRLDFESDPAAFESITDMIDAQLYGLFK